MRYQTKCKSCGLERYYTTEFEPKFCLKCSGELEIIRHSKARKTVEAKMAEMDEIAPRLEAARNAYWEVLVEYSDLLQFVANYHKRGVMTDEEYERYKIKGQNFPKNLNAAIAEYRRNKKKEEV